VKLLASASLVLLALASACGATESADSRDTGSERQTEASVNFAPPVPIESVLKMCRERGVRLTQAVSRMPVRGQPRSTGVMVYPEMTDQDVVDEFHSAGLREPKVLVQQIYIAGKVDDLQAFENEPNVQMVFLKPDMPYGE
jgi:hypothetical protein